MEGLKSELEENKKIIDDYKEIKESIEEKLQSYDAQFENSYVSKINFLFDEIVLLCCILK